MTDRELLNTDIDDLAAELDQYLWERVHMGDDRVCHDCERLAEMSPMSMAEWIDAGLEPGSGATVCGDYDRCALVPADLISIYPDLKTEGKIIIDDGLLSGEVVNMNTDYKTFAELDDLIGEYKEVTNGQKLLPEYYNINTVQGRIDFLRDTLDNKL
jgi:hypothetical protein